MPKWAFTMIAPLSCRLDLSMIEEVIAGKHSSLLKGRSRNIAIDGLGSCTLLDGEGDRMTRSRGNFSADRLSDLFVE